MRTSGDNPSHLPVGLQCQGYLRSLRATNEFRAARHLSSGRPPFGKYAGPPGASGGFASLSSPASSALLRRTYRARLYHPLQIGCAAGWECSRKKRTISREASGPWGSAYDPAGLPPDHACPAP